jgi:hypothetical protein
MTLQKPGTFASAGLFAYWIGLNGLWPFKQNWGDRFGWRPAKSVVFAGRSRWAASQALMMGWSTVMLIVSTVA